jgi:hypothetical protein
MIRVLLLASPDREGRKQVLANRASFWIVKVEEVYGNEGYTGYASCKAQ